MLCTFLLMSPTLMIPEPAYQRLPGENRELVLILTDYA